VLAALEVMREEPERRERLHRVAGYLRQELRSRGYWVLDGDTPIVPIVVPDAIALLRLCSCLLDEGVYANPVMRPAAKHNLLRISVTAAHDESHVERLLDALDVVMRRLEIPAPACAAS
jgi:8-amino-7-oxononanoate synthase